MARSTLGRRLMFVLAQSRGWRPSPRGRRAAGCRVRAGWQGAAVVGGGALLAQRAAPAGGSEDDEAFLAVTCRVTPAGQVTVPAAASTVKSSVVKPPSTAGWTGLGLITARCPACGDRSAQLPGPVGRIAVPGKRLVIAVRAPPGWLRHPRRSRRRPGSLGGQELRGHRRVTVLLASGPGQLLIGDDPGCRGRRPRAPGSRRGAPRGIAGVPGIGVDGGDHPVFGDLAGDPPPARRSRHCPRQARRPARRPGPAAPARRRPAHPDHGLAAPPRARSRR